MKNIYILLGFIALVSTLSVNAQVTIGKNQIPNPAAVLDIQSRDSLGLLLPVVALKDTVKSEPLTANVPGMFIYNTTKDDAVGLGEGVYFNDGRRWWPAGGGGTEPWVVSGTAGKVKASLNTQNIYQMGQVSVNTDTLLPLTQLNVVANNRGIMIPRLTEAERDSLTKKINNDSIYNSLMIYNTTEDCYNYYSRTDKEWQSLCGGMSKAVYTLDCSTVVANGTYVKGTALNGNNYLSMQVNVKKAGNYAITGTTSNNYGFSAQGTFLNEGLQTVLVPGQGQPKNTAPAPGDIVTLTLSGAESGCTSIKIPVLPPTATFSLSCGTAQFNGAYVKNKPLDATNTVTFNVNVSDISTGGTWAVSSNTVNGISFSGSGTFLTTGPQTVTLKGMGTPTGTDPITLTFTTNSGDGAATCTATVAIAIPPMRVLGLGDAVAGGGAANYGVFNTVNANATFAGKADNAKMVFEPKNFGTQPNSTVQFGDGVNTWTVNPNSGLATWPTVQAELTSATPPDIVFIGYSWYPAYGTDADAAHYFADYVRKGGVLLCFSETEPSATAGAFFNELLLDSILNTSGIITNITGNGAGGRYQFPTMNADPVINGPFGNLSGQYWGEDASTTETIAGLTPAAASQITVYTTATAVINATTGVTAAAPAGQGLPTMIRHNTLSFIWCGDGGFNSCYDHAATTICPFMVQQSPPYIPIPKNTYSGSNSVYGPGTVSNSIFFANALAWALNQAMTKGINKH